jgi:hypothetical protein
MPDQWYVRFIVDDSSDWKGTYRDYLAGENPTTGWGDPPKMTESGTEIYVYARLGTLPEENMGPSLSPPVCQARANTSDAHSTSHRMAWNIYTKTADGGGNFTSHYILSSDVNDGHKFNSIPPGYMATETPGDKMCVWVR